jgi:hypothetical protein
MSSLLDIFLEEQGEGNYCDLESVYIGKVFILYRHTNKKAPLLYQSVYKTLRWSWSFKNK